MGHIQNPHKDVIKKIPQKTWPHKMHLQRENDRFQATDHEIQRFFRSQILLSWINEFATGKCQFMGNNTYASQVRQQILGPHTEVQVSRVQQRYLGAYTDVSRDWQQILGQYTELSRVQQQYFGAKTNVLWVWQQILRPNTEVSEFNSSLSVPTLTSHEFDSQF